ncbi:MAG: hypothetical protein KDC33_00860 [Thermoleophilia bacterium]|nr:hypothetical protein [Thermoleophilia bacterium]
MFRDAAARSDGYRRHLAGRGVDASSVGDWEAIPPTSKAAVFGSPWEWAAADPGAAAEIVCSSGQSGPPFSVGLVSPGERDALAARTDGLLAALGAGPGSSTLLVNVLPMGVAAPCTLATVATPSVHLEMARHVLGEIAPRFDRLVLLGEPLFLAELARGWRARGPAHPDMWVFTGGEPVAASWKAYACGLLGIEPYRVAVSMGCAEIGLHLLFETPSLGAARAALAAGPGPGWARAAGPGVVPALLGYDPERLLVETPRRAGAGRLTLTPLHAALIPLVRYETGDLAHHLTDADVDDLAELTGVALDGPVVALFGRGGTPGGVPRPEAVKEALFSDAGLADQVTGRFRLEPAADGAPLTLHVQCRHDAPPAARHADTLRAVVAGVAGEPVDVRWHAAAEYPFHAPDDWTHKPRYTR